MCLPGQSYEIKLKKLGDLGEFRGKILKSVIRVGFYERRLQFMEKDLLQQWKQQRSTERILEIDIPLSYGVFEIIHKDNEINKCEFAWDPTKETGVFVKVSYNKAFLHFICHTCSLFSFHIGQLY